MSSNESSQFERHQSDLYHDNISQENEDIDFGSPERLTDGSNAWECRSQELYDSDPADYPLSSYHLKS